jgi:2-methylcitrate dehydratase
VKFRTIEPKILYHTTQGAYAVAAGVCRALGLSQAQTANAMAMAGTALNALRVTRTGTLSHWKGLAYANTAFGATHAASLGQGAESSNKERLRSRLFF